MIVILLPNLIIYEEYLVYLLYFLFVVISFTMTIHVYVPRETYSLLKLFLYDHGYVFHYSKHRLAKIKNTWKHSSSYSIKYHLVYVSLSVSSNYPINIRLKLVSYEDMKFNIHIKIKCKY
jgi:hypothetical protein